MSNLFQKWEVIRDTYTIVDFLGQGAFGQVYKIRHRFLGMQALKVFFSGTFKEDDRDELFQEAWVLSEITHPNVVRIYDANSLMRGKDQLYYLSMEYINGCSLDSFYLGERKISMSTTLKLMCDICDGLSQAHAKPEPIIHRDVKPQNILIRIDREAYTAKVSDFGLARHVSPKAKMLNAAGTIPFMAPEGSQNQLTPASDVFSAGIVFYLMLTRSFPFEIPEKTTTNTQKELHKVLIDSRRETPRLPSKINAEVDKGLDEIVMRSLKFDAKDRYQTAVEMGDALKCICQKISVISSQKKEAAKLLEKALGLAKQYSTLPDAVLSMESAFSKDAALINQYGKILDQWRKGILM